jgi:hypothetical protein
MRKQVLAKQHAELLIKAKEKVKEKGTGSVKPMALQLKQMKQQMEKIEEVEMNFINIASISQTTGALQTITRQYTAGRDEREKVDLDQVLDLQDALKEQQVRFSTTGVQRLCHVGLTGLLLLFRKLLLKSTRRYRKHVRGTALLNANCFRIHLTPHFAGTLPNAGADILHHLSDDGPPSGPGTSQEALLEQELLEIHELEHPPQDPPLQDPQPEREVTLPDAPTSIPSTSTITTNQPRKTEFSAAPVLQFV